MKFFIDEKVFCDICEVKIGYNTKIFGFKVSTPDGVEYKKCWKCRKCSEKSDY